MVLLDPTHPEHWRRMQVDAPTQAALLSGMRVALFSSTMRREFDDQEKCLDTLATLPPVNTPTRVLTRTRFELVERGPFERMVRTLEPDWMSLTGAKSLEPVPGSGHYIHRDQPLRVVAAVASVSSEASARKE
jgi:pimeloyl-ACP methyl ester carboxylesterase